MSVQPCRILLVEDSLADAELLGHLLRSGPQRPFTIVHATTLREGLELAAREAFDVMLLDLNLPDSRGIETVSQAHGRLPRLPVVVLTGIDDEEMGLHALRCGAQDYLVKGECDCWATWRAIRYSMERKAAQEALEEALRSLGIRAGKLETDLAAAATELRNAALQLAHAEQRERERMAQVLHDNLQQLLYAAKLSAEAVAKDAGGKAVAAAENLEKLVDRSLEVTRSLVVELVPPAPKGLDLPAALQWLGKQMEELHGLKVQLQAEPHIQPLTQQAQAVLYQCVRELLFNVVKHAKVKAADVRIDRGEGVIRIRVSDEGAGFDPEAVLANESAASCLGLRAIRERVRLLGGRMEVSSKVGCGSSFLLSIPVN